MAQTKAEISSVEHHAEWAAWFLWLCLDWKVKTFYGPVILAVACDNAASFRCAVKFQWVHPRIFFYFFIYTTRWAFLCLSIIFYSIYKWLRAWLCCSDILFTFTLTPASCEMNWWCLCPAKAQRHLVNVEAQRKRQARAKLGDAYELPHWLGHSVGTRFERHDRL